MIAQLPYYAAALALIALLIGIHEFGHYLAARLCGVAVRVVSIGFGSRLFGINVNGTDYRVSAIPFGGYVRMAGADPFANEGDAMAPQGLDDEDADVPVERRYSSKTVWQRLFITLAGPAANLALPFGLFTALFVWGEPQPRSDIGGVQPGSPAENAGVRPLDHIAKVNGVAVETWVDIYEFLSTSNARNLDLELVRGGVTRSVSIALPFGADGKPDLTTVGISRLAPDTTLAIDDPHSPAGIAGLLTGDQVLEVGGRQMRDWNEVREAVEAAGDTVTIRWQRGEKGDDEEGEIVEGVATLVAATTLPEMRPADNALWQRWGLMSANTTIGTFSEGSAAEAGGLQKGDRLLAIDGTPIRAWGDVVTAIAGAASGEGELQTTRTVTIEVRRAGEVLDLPIQPAVVRDTDEWGRYRWRALLGIGAMAYSVQPENVIHPYPFVQAAKRASRETVAVSGAVVEQIGKLITGEAAPSKSLGGPVEMFRQTKKAAEEGLFTWGRLMGFLSINLGIFNLLPVPVFDGGQALILAAEALRGRPLPLILRERALQVGFIFTVLLFLFVVVIDLQR